MFNISSTTAIATNPDRIMHKAVFTKYALLIELLAPSRSEFPTKSYLGCLILSLLARLLDYFND